MSARSPTSPSAPSSKATVREQIEVERVHGTATGGGYAILSGQFERIDDPRFSFSRIVKPELPRSVVLANTLRRPHTLATRAVQKLIEHEAPGLMLN